MALSTLLRSTWCMNRTLGSHILHVAASPTSLIAQNPAAVMPIFNKVQSFSTSAVQFASAKGDHTKIWVLEKIVSAALVPLLPLAIMFPNKVFDSALAIAVVAHTFWGFEAIAQDYVRPIIFGPIIPKIALALVYLISFSMLGGLFYIIQHDIGLANAIRQLWSIKPKNTN